MALLDGAIAPVDAARSVALAPGQEQLVVPFEARTPEGVVVRREYVLTRGSYVIAVRDHVREGRPLSAAMTSRLHPM